MQKDTSKTFFSYARADSEFALKLAEDMRTFGINLWIDQLDIPAGARWDQTVENALKSCQSLLIILSPAAAASQNVMDEVGFAIDRDKRIFPVLYRDCDIPFRLRRLQHIDFTKDYNNAFVKLSEVLAAGSNGEDTITRSSGPIGHRKKTTASIALIPAGIFILAMIFFSSRFSWQPYFLKQDWLTFEEYEKAFNNQVKAGFYPYKVEGKCQDGGERFHVEWKAFPLGSLGFVAQHGVTREIYDAKNRENTAEGFTLESLNSFRGCNEEELYQANWFKRNKIDHAK